MIHITCLSNALDRVCETIRSEYPLVDDLIGTIKRGLAYSKNGKKQFIEIVGFSPRYVVLTRWGTFIEAAKFYAINYKKVQDWIDTLKGTSDCVETLRKLRFNTALDRELISIQDCVFILEYIEKFQARGL